MQSLSKSLVLFIFLAISSYGQCVLGLNPKTKKLECVGGASVSGGAVGGASNLTTVGAVPYVVSAGVLGQAPTGLFYDAANVTLQVGTSNTKVFLGNIVSGSTYPGVWLGNITPSITNYSLLLDAGFSTILNAQSASHSLDFRQASNIRARLAATTGNFLIGPSGTDGNYKLDVQASGSTGTMRVFDQGGAGSTLAVIQAGASQSGNLLSVRNNAGTELASVSSGGNVQGQYFISANGTGFYWLSRSVLLSPSDGVIQISNNAGSDFNRLQFGGTTSSFPAIKRSSAGLQARLADDSAFTTIQASNYISNDGSTGITGATCSSFKNGICVAP